MDTADRSITLTRLIAAPPAKVWRAWSDPVLLPRWFGPQGYSCTTKSIDLRQGGHWIFDMTGPDGTIWPNRHRYTLWQAAERIDFLMDDGVDGDVPAEIKLRLLPEGEGTRLTYVMVFPTAEMKRGAEAFGAVELGQTTFAKLAALVEGLAD